MSWVFTNPTETKQVRAKHNGLPRASKLKDIPKGAVPENMMTRPPEN